MIKVIKIETCLHCLSYVHTMKLTGCLKLGKELKNDKIPKNCPLPTIEEFCESNFNIDKE